MINDNPKVIYLIATGCRRSREIHVIYDRLTQNGFKVYAFATQACTDLVDFSDEKYKQIMIRTKKNSQKNHEIEKEDMVVVAPCSFNTLNKIADGIADSYPLTIIHSAIGRGVPVVIALSINIDLWHNAATQRAIDKLQSIKNVHIIWPRFMIDEEKNAEVTTMVPWSKIEDTIFAKFKKLYFTPVCQCEDNIYIRSNNSVYNELSVFGKACKKLNFSSGTAGCIAKKTEHGIVISATGTDLGNLKESDMVLITSHNDKTITYSGTQKPSSEGLLVVNLLENAPVGTCFLHCHCRGLTYSNRARKYSTKDYFMSNNKDHVEEVQEIIEKFGIVNLLLHGQVLVGDSFEYILGKVIREYTVATMENKNE